MQGLKHAAMVVFAVAVISFVASVSDRRKNRVPRGVRDRIKTTIKAASQNTLIAHSTSNQNPVAAMLRLTADSAMIDNLRSMYSDQDLSDMTHIDIEALADLVKTEQHKAFQRVAYFLPVQVSQDAITQWYWPQSVYSKRPGPIVFPPNSSVPNVPLGHVTSSPGEALTTTPSTLLPSSASLSGAPGESVGAAETPSTS